MHITRITTTPVTGRRIKVLINNDCVDDWLDTKRQRKSQESSAVSSSSSAKKSSNTDTEESRSSSAGASSDLCNDRTIYVEGLPYAATEQDIRDFFEPCGSIQNIRLPRWHDSGRLRGYGHVEFHNSKSVKKALELDGKPSCNDWSRRRDTFKVYFLVDEHTFSFFCKLSAYNHPN
jgi:RNA recognition motif-containing protein